MKTGNAASRFPVFFLFVIPLGLLGPFTSRMADLQGKGHNGGYKQKEKQPQELT